MYISMTGCEINTRKKCTDWRFSCKSLVINDLRKGVMAFFCKPLIANYLENPTTHKKTPTFPKGGRKFIVTFLFFCKLAVGLVPIGIKGSRNLAIYWTDYFEFLNLSNDFLLGSRIKRDCFHGLSFLACFEIFKAKSHFRI